MFTIMVSLALLMGLMIALESWINIKLVGAVRAASNDLLQGSLWPFSWKAKEMWRDIVVSRKYRELGDQAVNRWGALAYAVFVVGRFVGFTFLVILVVTFLA
jgi:hypothetical protein